MPGLVPGIHVSSTVIPGWSEGPDLRCAIAHRGISRFSDVQSHIPVRCFASPRNDDGTETAMSVTRKAWMAGASPAMTVDGRASSAPELLGKHLLQDLPLHLLGRRDETVGHFAEIRVGVVQAEDQPARSNPAQRQPFGAQRAEGLAL